MTLIPALKEALVQGGRDDIAIVVGGIVPPEDFEALRDAGVEAIFPPGTVIAEAAATLIEKLNRRLGHAESCGRMTDCPRFGSQVTAEVATSCARDEP